MLRNGIEKLLSKTEYQEFLALKAKLQSEHGLASFADNIMLADLVFRIVRAPDRPSKAWRKQVSGLLSDLNIRADRRKPKGKGTSPQQIIVSILEMNNP